MIGAGRSGLRLRFGEASEILYASRQSTDGTADPAAACWSRLRGLLRLERRDLWPSIVAVWLCVPSLWTTLRFWCRCARGATARGVLSDPEDSAGCCAIVLQRAAVAACGCGLGASSGDVHPAHTTPACEFSLPLVVFSNSSVVRCVPGSFLFFSLGGSMSSFLFRASHCPQ